MNESITAYDNTIMGEINNWKRIEATINENSGSTVLDHRDWLQLRLKEYERIIRKFKGSASSLDERAWLIVANVEWQKVEKALYPSVLVRMIRRIKNAVADMLDIRRNQQQALENVYNDSVFRQDSFQAKQMQTDMPSASQSQDMYAKRPVGPDLGGKREVKTGNGLHV